MKQKFKSVLSLILLALISIGSLAQLQRKAHPEIPKWVSDKGYWVIESNIHTPLDHIVSFYNNDQVLLYKETLNGVKLDPEKRRVKMKLKKLLEAAAFAWEKKKKPEPLSADEFGLVKAAF
jgi:hypothetical protein